MLFDHGGLGLIKLSADGTIEFISQGLCDALGYEMHELNGQSVQNITHPDDIALDEEMVAQLESGQLTNYTFEKR